MFSSKEVEKDISLDEIVSAQREEFEDKITSITLILTNNEEEHLTEEVKNLEEIFEYLKNKRAEKNMN